MTRLCFSKCGANWRNMQEAWDDNLTEKNKWNAAVKEK